MPEINIINLLTQGYMVGLAFGKDSNGNYVPILVNSSGEILTS